MSVDPHPAELLGTHSTCPACDVPLELVARGVWIETASVALLVCPACGIEWKLTAGLERVGRRATPSRPGTSGGPRIDVRPLIDYAVSRWRPPSGAHDQTGSTARAAEVLGCPTSTVWRWMKEGIPARSADEICARLDRHPLEFWPDFHTLWPTDDSEGALT